MELSLPTDLADFVSAKVASGQFRTVGEVAIAALRHYRDAQSPKLAELRAALAVADGQLERGEYIELADETARRNYFDHLKQRKSS